MTWGLANAWREKIEKPKKEHKALLQSGMACKQLYQDHDYAKPSKNGEELEDLLDDDILVTAHNYRGLDGHATTVSAPISGDTRGQHILQVVV